MVTKDGTIVSIGANGSEQMMQQEMEAELAKQSEDLLKKQKEIEKVEAEGAMVKEEKEKLLDTLNKQKEGPWSIKCFVDF